MDTPPEEIVCRPVRLRRWTVEDLPRLVEASASSWDELRPWMPWAQERATAESSLPFLAGAEDQWRSGEAHQYTVLGTAGAGTGGGAGAGARAGLETGAGEELVRGSCGLMRHIGAGGLEIGYWVRTSHTGRGLATAAATALTWAGLRLDGIDHVEIHCDAANVRSAAVPARLGYRLVETRPSEPTAPRESGQEQVWRLTEAEWPTSPAAAQWRNCQPRTRSAGTTRTG